MRTLPRKFAYRTGLALLVAPLLLIGQGCTELTETPNDALTPETAFKTPTEVLAGVAGVYAQLRPIEWVGFITLEDLTTDVSIVPTRGSDWYDNGQWLDLHRQTWTANSAGSLAFVGGAWNDMFNGVAKANLMLDVVNTAVTGAVKDTISAELRTLRAWDYYMLHDMFGGVPLVTTTELKQYPRSTRTEIFNFVESELLAAVPSLPNKWDAGNWGRITKGAANAILASLYLNAGVFKKDAGVSATAYNSCAGVQVSGGKNACQAAIDAANAVINSGVYTLNPDWKKNFSLDNKSSPENIFVVVHTEKGSGIGGNWPMRTLHYNQLSTGDGSPWNGFATIAETYQQFNQDDRQSMWLAGQAFSFQTNQPVNDRTGNPLIFTATIADADAASEGEGVRFNKFPPLPSAPHGSAHPNDFTFFRLAEMYLIRAEAENELGQTAAALTDLRLIHDRHTTNPITAATQQQIRDAILKERLLEFAGEGKRRTDMIRHGKFLSWTESSAHGVCGAGGPANCPTRDAHLLLFPVASPVLQANPQLTQNPGY